LSITPELEETGAIGRRELTCGDGSRLRSNTKCHGSKEDWNSAREHDVYGVGGSF
jgi:hypothetical protein